MRTEMYNTSVACLPQRMIFKIVDHITNQSQCQYEYIVLLTNNVNDTNK